MKTITTILRIALLLIIMGAIFVFIRWVFTGDDTKEHEANFTYQMCLQDARQRYTITEKESMYKTDVEECREMYNLKMK